MICDTTYIDVQLQLLYIQMIYSCICWRVLINNVSFSNHFIHVYTCVVLKHSKYHQQVKQKNINLDKSGKNLNKEREKSGNFKKPCRKRAHYHIEDRTLISGTSVIN